MANIFYRGSSVPSAANASSAAQNRPLTNDEIDKNFYALNASKLESESDTLSTVTARGASTSTAVSMTGANTFGDAGVTTTINGTLKVTNVKGPNNANISIYGGDITGDPYYTLTISGGNRTSNGQASDSGGALTLKGGDANGGDGSYLEGGQVQLYGGDVNAYTLGGQSIEEFRGGDITIISGTVALTQSLVKRSGNVYIDVASVGSNGTRYFGEIKIGTGAGYKAGGTYASPTITIGGTSSIVNLKGTAIVNDIYVNSTNATTSGIVRFQNAASAPGASYAYMLGYYNDDLLIRIQPFGGGTTSTPFKFSANGNFTLTGSIFATGDVVAYYSSDITLKTNVVKITDALAKVNSLDGVTFNWNDLAKERYGRDTSVREAGVIAQQVQNNLPEVVKTREDGTLAVDYEKMVPLLIEAIKELANKVEVLQNQLNNK